MRKVEFSPLVAVSKVQQTPCLPLSRLSLLGGLNGHELLISAVTGFDNVMMKNIYVQHLTAPISQTTPDSYFMASDIGTVGQFAADWQICATNTAEQPVTLKIAFVEPPQGYQIG